MNQPTLNVGVIGSVGHGKTQLIKALTGQDTIKFKKEREQNITIKLGYAETKIYNLDDDYYTTNMPKEAKLIKWISFVDCPGHHAYMSTMLSGISVFDAVIILVAVNEIFPSPQFIQHLNALHIVSNKIDKNNIIIVQNKIDLVDEYTSRKNYYDIKNYISKTAFENSPIIPVCAIKKSGMSTLCKYISQFNDPFSSKNNMQYMYIIRSFKVKEEEEKKEGGVIGGSIINGTFKVGQTISIRPGLLNNTTNKYEFLQTKITNIQVSDKKLTYATKGGLIALQTTLDSLFTKQNNLVGQVAVIDGFEDEKFKVFKKLSIKYQLFDNMVNIPFEIDEKVIISVGSNRLYAIVYECKKNKIKIKLSEPIYASVDDIVSISKLISNMYVLYAYSMVPLNYTSNFCVEQEEENDDNDDNYSKYLMKIYEDDEIIVKKTKISLPAPILSRSPTGILWSNFNDLCNKINRASEHIILYIETELGILGSSSIDQELNLNIRSKNVGPKILNGVVKKYIKSYVQCELCSNIDTIIEKKDDLMIMNCNICKSNRSIAKIQKGFVAGIVKGQRRTVRRQNIIDNKIPNKLKDIIQLAINDIFKVEVDVILKKSIKSEFDYQTDVSKIIVSEFTSNEVANKIVERVKEQSIEHIIKNISVFNNSWYINIEIVKE